MPRWEPHARERLEAAALDLFETQGYDATTVDDIARRAGVTTRTVFRHFTDKREVLFGNAGEIHACITGALEEVDADVAAADAGIESIKACDRLFPRRGQEFLRRRAAVIAAAVDLQDREDRKLRDICVDVASTLRRRGLQPLDATIVADYVVKVVLVHASDLWVREPRTSFATAVDRVHHRGGALLEPPARRVD